MSIPESDWKIFKSLREKALTRLCDRILEEIQTTSANENLSSHEKYLEIFSLIRERDKELGQIFDGLSRSKALLQLALIQSHELATSEELNEFGESTREYLEHFKK